jgi:uncharacterized membrane protein
VQRVVALFVRSFFKGVIILAPLAVTFYLIILVFTKIDALVPWVPQGVGFLIIVLAVTGIGFLGTRWFLGKVVFDFIEHLLERTPGIKHIYSSVKDVLDSFVGDKRKFNRPVWVRTNADPELWRVGFLTQDDMSHLGLHEMVAVYLPHSYAISGWVIVVRGDNIKPITTMNAADAMKFAVSGGISNYNVAEVKQEVQKL